MLEHRCGDLCSFNHKSFSGVKVRVGARGHSFGHIPNALHILCNSFREEPHLCDAQVSIFFWSYSVCSIWRFSPLFWSFTFNFTVGNNLLGWKNADGRTFWSGCLPPFHSMHLSHMTASWEETSPSVKAESSLRGSLEGLGFKISNVWSLDQNVTHWAMPLKHSDFFWFLGTAF